MRPVYIGFEQLAVRRPRPDLVDDVRAHLTGGPVHPVGASPAAVRKRKLNVALSSAAIVALHPAASEAQTLSMSRAQAAAAPRVGELKVDLTWPFDPIRYTQTWGKHKRHSKRIVELRVILTDPKEHCTESGETEGPLCENNSTEECFRIGVIHPWKKLREDPAVQDLWDPTGKLIVGRPKRIDCDLARPKQRSRGRSTGPRGR